jgi:amidase
MGVETDPEVAQAVRDTALLLEEMGHHVSEASPVFDGLATMRAMIDVWFFGFNLRIDGYAARSGHPIGPDTLEPVVLMIYEHATGMKPAHFLGAMAAINTARRQLARVFTQHDVWLSPTTPHVAEPWGIYNLGRSDVTMETLAEIIYRRTCQFTLPHNIMGTPAISLPLAMHSTRLPIGIQIGAPHAQEHVVLQIAAALEAARPWSARVPPVHASRV